jgi:hypothetical protein
MNMKNYFSTSSQLSYTEASRRRRSQRINFNPRVSPGKEGLSSCSVGRKWNQGLRSKVPEGARHKRISLSNDPVSSAGSLILGNGISSI